MPDHAAFPQAPAVGIAHSRQGLRAHLLALVLAVVVPALGISTITAWYLVGSYR